MNACLIRLFWFKVSFHIYTTANQAKAVVSAIRIPSYLEVYKALFSFAARCGHSANIVEYYDNLYSTCIDRQSLLSVETKTKQTAYWVAGQHNCSSLLGIPFCTTLEPANFWRTEIAPWTYSSTGHFFLFFKCRSSDKKPSSGKE